MRTLVTTLSLFLLFAPLAPVHAAELHQTVQSHSAPAERDAVERREWFGRALDRILSGGDGGGALGRSSTR